MHMRGVYPSQIEGMEQLMTNVFWQMKGKPKRLVSEPLNFADDIV